MEVVLPLLPLLEGPFKENAYSPEDSTFEVESDLTELQCVPDERSLGVSTEAASYGLKARCQ